VGAAFVRLGVSVREMRLLGVVTMLRAGLLRSSAAIPEQGQEVSVFSKASTLAVGSTHTPL